MKSKEEEGMGIDIKIWQFLINRLDEGQRKEILKRENLIIGSIQTKFVSKQTQWKIVLNRLNSELNNPTVQRVIMEYYIDSQVPRLKEDINVEAEHLKELEAMEENDFEKYILDHGFLYVLLYLIVKRDTEKINKLIKYESSDNVVEKEDNSSKIETTNILKKITELKNELSFSKKAHKGLQKKYDTLEKKYNEVIIKMNKDIEKIKNEYYKETEDALNTIESDRNEHEEQLKILREENRNLENLLQEERRKKIERKESKLILTETIGNNEVEGVGNKRNKSKVLVFGDLPIAIQKQEQYEFIFFKNDISNYLFNEDFDEYWCIEDKMSAKEKKQLQRNIHYSKVTFEKKHYSKLVR